MDLMERGGDVYVVLSNPGSIGNGGSPCYNDVPLETLAKRLKDNVQKRICTADPIARYAIRKGPDPVNAQLCSRFHLALLRFGPHDYWPGNKTIANHSKLWMVDDRVFYIGSDNMSPGEPAGIRLSRPRSEGRRHVDRVLLETGLAVVEPCCRLG